MKVTKTKLLSVIDSVRKSVTESRLRQTRKDVEIDVLYGQCVENANILAKNLSEEFPDARIKIVHGGINLNREPTPSTYNEAKKYGTIHHWVVITDETGSSFHCDLAREGNRISGEPLLSQTKPSEYIEFYRKKWQN